MHRWREKYPDHKAVKKAADSTYGEMSDDAVVSEAADDIYSVAASHRSTVIARDKAAKARKRSARR